MSGPSTLLQDTLEKENANPAGSEAPPQGTSTNESHDPRDFFMRMNGTETYWPALLLASALIVISIVFLVSLAFGKGIG